VRSKRGRSVLLDSELLNPGQGDDEVGVTSSNDRSPIAKGMKA
jgi:hypothetical protein